MTAATATAFFLALCEQTGEDWHAEVDALAVGQTRGILAPAVLAHVAELKQRGWIEESPTLSWGQLTIRVTFAGVGHYASEKTRRTGILGSRRGVVKRPL